MGDQHTRQTTRSRAPRATKSSTLGRSQTGSCRAAAGCSRSWGWSWGLSRSRKGCPTVSRSQSSASWSLYRSDPAIAFSACARHPRLLMACNTVNQHACAAWPHAAAGHGKNSSNVGHGQLACYWHSAIAMPRREGTNLLPAVVPLSHLRQAAALLHQGSRQLSGQRCARGTSRLNRQHVDSKRCLENRGPKLLGADITPKNHHLLADKEGGCSRCQGCCADSMTSPSPRMCGLLASTSLQ